MTDRELLELAAKAYGDERIHWNEHRGYFVVGDEWDAYGPLPWDPLNDDGDALRLAVKLGLNVRALPTSWVTVRMERSRLKLVEVPADNGGCIFAAARRAIVRAAALIGHEAPRAL